VAIGSLLGVGVEALAQKPVKLNDPSTIVRITMMGFQPLHADGKVLVIDTRDAIAFEGGRIPGALNVSLDQVEKRVEEIRAKAAGKPIVLYCSCPSEHTSAEAALILYKHGMKDVRALVGGYAEWLRSGGKVER
jgi:rhodanese-related sulfurtransferase